MVPTTATVIHIDPLLGRDAADEMLAARDRFGSYGMYSNEGFDTAYAAGLPQRWDAAANYICTGGVYGDRADEDDGLLATRTNYFRETYAYGDEIALPGIEGLRTHHRLMTAAAELHGRPVIEPAIVYANIHTPGQELALHTDVPEFRGANRKVVPQWLLVVMHHSGLFVPWRLPIATAICYFGHVRGGDLVVYPRGPEEPSEAIPAAHDTAVVLDTDATFHGVARVEGDESRLAAMRSGQRLWPLDGAHWSLRDASGTDLASFAEDELRFSVSWKAYCFTDEAERDLWRGHGDDLSLDTILDSLEADLTAQGALTAGRPSSEEDFAQLLIDHYIHFPTTA